MHNHFKLIKATLLLHLNFVGGDFAVTVDGKDAESFGF